MNPRYVAYARAYGKTPDEMLAYDRGCWPGGCMVGFMLWMSEMFQKRAKELGQPHRDGFTVFLADDCSWDSSMASFDRWLDLEADCEAAIKE